LIEPFRLAREMLERMLSRMRGEPSPGFTGDLPPIPTGIQDHFAYRARRGELPNRRPRVETLGPEDFETRWRDC
jgi:hypothetical protein